MKLVQQARRRYISSSSEYQLTRKIEILRKEIKIWTAQYYNYNVHNIDQIKQSWQLHKIMLWTTRLIFGLVLGGAIKEIN